MTRLDYKRTPSRILGIKRREVEKLSEFMKSSDQNRLDEPAQLFSR